MKIKRVISCLLVAVFSMSLLLVQESAQAKIGTVQKILPSELHVEGRYIYNAEGEKVRLTGANIPDLQWATGGDNDLMKRVGLVTVGMQIVFVCAFILNFGLDKNGIRVRVMVITAKWLIM